MPSVEYEEIIFEKIRVLNETLWEGRVDRQRVNRWLSNFADQRDRHHALYLLSQFMYFGSLQMRELLKGAFRDVYKYRVIEQIRQNNHHTTDLTFIKDEFNNILQKTRFLGVGNPFESGTHLLYFFRQENRLPKKLFIDINELFDYQEDGTSVLHFPDVDEYVFFDDFCGSGTQAKSYSKGIVARIRDLKPSANISYLMLFSTKAGKDHVRTKTKFNYVEAVVELDESFRCFGTDSRYFDADTPTFIDRAYAEDLCSRHGLEMMQIFWQKEGVPTGHIPVYADKSKLGFGDCQLLIGFHHNTPDNTLPIFWWDEESPIWYPIFKRYNKIYG